MEINDKTIAENPAELKLLVDSSAYLCMQELAKAIGIHVLDLIDDHYPNVDYFFSQGMINELIKGREGFNALGLFNKSLQDEGVSIDDEFKDNRFLYNSKDGSVRSAKLTTVSHVDSGQILLCQNHPELVLLTNDHRMLKNAAALLDRRLMDFLNLLELMCDTPDVKIRLAWQTVKAHYEKTGYKRPETVRNIPDRQPGELPAHLRA